MIIAGFTFVMSFQLGVIIFNWRSNKPGIRKTQETETPKSASVEYALADPPSTEVKAGILASKVDRVPAETHVSFYIEDQSSRRCRTLSYEKSRSNGVRLLPLVRHGVQGNNQRHRRLGQLYCALAGRMP
jgi:hypothetical protein